MTSKNKKRKRSTDNEEKLKTGAADDASKPESTLEKTASEGCTDPPPPVPPPADKHNLKQKRKKKKKKKKRKIDDSPAETKVAKQGDELKESAESHGEFFWELVKFSEFRRMNRSRSSCLDYSSHWSNDVQDWQLLLLTKCQ